MYKLGGSKKLSLTSQVFELPSELYELSLLPQWVSYRKVWNVDKCKFDKIPLNPRNGTRAKANDSSTWGTFAEAFGFAQCHGFFHDSSGGLGFELSFGYAGIDLDDVILSDGSLKPFAADIVRLMDSYTEYSPSGKGIHILFKLSTPLSEIGSRRRNDSLGLEMYDSARYFTVTGKIYGKAKTIAERSKIAQKIYNEYLLISGNKNHATGELGALESKNIYRGDIYSDSDSELLEKMFSSFHGGKILALYNGDILSYDNDESRADLALCNYFAFWTNNDLVRMDRLFRKSGLMRPKWDEKRGSQTYGELTLRKALRSEGYSALTKLQVSDVGVLSVKNSEVQSESESESKTLSSVEVVNVRDYLKGTVMDKELQRFQFGQCRKTGYSNLDEKMILYPGLYVLGAISSLGKTTFCGQMADQLASNGEHVLYFTLEQSKLELVCKGISRLTAQMNIKDAVSSMDIRRGIITDLVKEARLKYADITEHEYIVECDFDTTVEVIVSTVKDYILRTGSSPIVIVDYLQIITPVNTYQTTKDVVDYNVRALKKLQAENDLVVLVISSLNRANYLTPIDFSSFKESGGIEYTADVIWGLQLSVMNNELFDKDSKLKLKRDMVREAKIANPREIELVCLKNRYGISSYTCRFKYYAKYDYFRVLRGE